MLLAACGWAHAGVLHLDLPSIPLGTFGQVFTADHLGPAHGVVTGASVHLEFHTATSFGNFDAANFFLELEAPVGPGIPSYPEWELTGPGLGWSGNGVFTADLQTSALNGLILDGQGKPGSFSLWFIRIINGAGSLPIGGQLVDSYFEIQIEPVPAPAAPAVVVAMAWLTRRRRRGNP
jgi:hypothetical protein